jgi:hypothetical protein
MRATIVRRIERLEDQAPPAEPPEPHVIVFVNPDRTEHSRIMLTPNGLRRESAKTSTAG